MIAAGEPPVAEVPTLPVRFLPGGLFIWGQGGAWKSRAQPCAATHTTHSQHPAETDVG